MVNDTKRHVAILVSNYFEQSEFEEPLHALQDAGHTVTVISSETLRLQGMNHADKGDVFQADMLLDDADASNYDALLLPGGTLNADALRTVEKAQEWVIDFLDSNRLLAVICHAPWLLVSADAVEGARITSYYTIRDDITNAGGEWVDLPVVVDGMLVTSRQPSDLTVFIETTLKKLSQAADLLDDDTTAMPDSHTPVRAASTTMINRSTEAKLQLNAHPQEDTPKVFNDDLDDTTELNDPKTLYPSIVAPKDEHSDTH
jgi:protease I